MGVEYKKWLMRAHERNMKLLENEEKYQRSLWKKYIQCY